MTGKKVAEKLDEVLNVAKEVLGEDVVEANENVEDLMVVAQSEIAKLKENTNPPALERIRRAPVYDSELDDDYHQARSTLKQLIVTAEDTLDRLLLVANNSEHPRAYEVAAKLIESITNCTNNLIELQRSMREIRKTDDGSDDKKSQGLNVQKADNVTNFIFQGTTAELQDMIRKQIGRNT